MTPPSSLDRFLAGVCQLCPVCRRARARPEGWAAQFVRTIEARTCPFCRAYARVHGRAAHAPAPGGTGREDREGDKDATP